MGALFLVVAAGVAVAFGGDPEAGESVAILGLVFGLAGLAMAAAGFALLRKAGRRARVEAAGVSGTARVMGLTQTGMTLNDQPQIGMDLEVSVLGMGTYRAEHKEFVPLLLLSRLRPGAVLAVKVNPANRTQIVIRWGESPTGDAADAGGAVA